MKPYRGIILVRFTAEQIHLHNRPSTIIKDLTVDHPANPNEYSPEVATVESVSDYQSFFRAGDRVLISYVVFMVGKHRRFMKTQRRRVDVLPNGDEIYWCYDGTDIQRKTGEPWNQSDLFARLTDTTVEMYPGYAIISPPTITEKTAGGLHVPDYLQKDNRKQAFWANILYINGNDAENLNLAVGQEVLCDGELSYDVRTNQGPLHVIRTRYIAAKKPLHEKVPQL